MFFSLSSGRYVHHVRQVSPTFFTSVTIFSGRATLQPKQTFDKIPEDLGQEATATGHTDSAVRLDKPVRHGHSIVVAGPVFKLSSYAESYNQTLWIYSVLQRTARITTLLAAGDQYMFLLQIFWTIKWLLAEMTMHCPPWQLTPHQPVSS